MGTKDNIYIMCIITIRMGYKLRTHTRYALRARLMIELRIHKQVVALNARITIQNNVYSLCMPIVGTVS